MSKPEPPRRSTRRRTATVRTGPDLPEGPVQRPKQTVRTQHSTQPSPKTKKRNERQEHAALNIQNPSYDYSSDSEAPESVDSSDGEPEDNLPPPPPPPPQQAGHSRLYRIKKKSNQRQYYFNNQVLKQVEWPLMYSLRTRPKHRQRSYKRVAKSCSVRKFFG